MERLSSQQIFTSRLTSNQECQKLMTRNAQICHNILKLASQSDLSSINKRVFVQYNPAASEQRKELLDKNPNQQSQQSLQPSPNHAIFFYFVKYHPQKQHLDQLAMYLLKTIHDQLLESNLHQSEKYQQSIPTKAYSIVFFNHNALNHNTYSEFKQIFMCFEEMYFTRLHSIVLVKPKFYQRNLQNQNAQHKGHSHTTNIFNDYYQQKLHDVENCQQLCQRFHIDSQDLIKHLPVSICEQDFPQLAKAKLIKKPSLPNYRNNLIGQEEGSINSHLMHSEINSIVEGFIESSWDELEDYPLNENGVPILLWNLVLYFTNDRQNLKNEGLFRKSISIDDEKQALEQLYQYNFDYFTQNSSNCHIVAVMIKRFLTNLKSPIIPYKHTQAVLDMQIMEIKSETDKLEETKLLINALPDTNYQSLAFLCRFLAEDVIKFSRWNKMSVQNVGICFGPCLMRKQSQQLGDFNDALKINQFVEYLVGNYDKIFQIQRQEQIAWKFSSINRKSFIEDTLKFKIEEEQEEQEGENQNKNQKE